MDDMRIRFQKLDLGAQQAAPDISNQLAELAGAGAGAGAGAAAAGAGLAAGAGPAAGAALPDSAAGGAAGALPLKSVAYQPLPLSWKPAAVSCLCSAGAWQLGHSVRGASEIFCSASNAWPQSAHLYA